MTAVVFEEPMSSPVMMCSGFIDALRLPDRDNGNRAHQQVPVGERDRFQRERYRPTARLTVLLAHARATFDGSVPPNRLRRGTLSPATASAESPHAPFALLPGCARTRAAQWRESRRRA